MIIRLPGHTDRVHRNGPPDRPEQRMDILGSPLRAPDGETGYGEELPGNEQNLLDWVKDYSSTGNKFSMIIDPRLGNHYPCSAAKRVGILAESCLRKNAKDRPTMRQKAFSLVQTVASAAVFSAIAGWYGFMFGRESARKELGELIKDLRKGGGSPGDEVS
ncbi:hypothetical protein MLD38_015494 [Melastoma candidum]|uniref:Uncharacterized protein n=1 Tax=Melastoma candidum TaxID=119954 RepID=A0ACB9RHL9_9MYRT|nr:hypothetical protein MLD38_015494 [Melastoma candidum]